MVTFSELVIWVASVMNWWKTEASMPGGRTRGFAGAMGKDSSRYEWKEETKDKTGDHNGRMM